MERSSYDDVRGKMGPGDVIAFLGDSALSSFIEAGTGVSHAGIIVAAADEREPEPILLETTLCLLGTKPTCHAIRSSFKKRCAGYNGEVWWLPMHPKIQKGLRKGAFAQFASAAIGTPFDIAQGLKVVLQEWYDKFSAQFVAPPEIKEPFFCAELVAKALQYAGMESLKNASDIHPADLCAWRIYEDSYFHLRGEGKEIPRYNELHP